MFVLTRAQRVAAFNLYRKNPNGHASYRSFRRALVRPMLFGFGAIEVYPYSGMYVGIELDGYAHT
jgi:hypothetical protein